MYPNLQIFLEKGLKPRKASLIIVYKNLYYVIVDTIELVA